MRLKNTRLQDLFLLAKHQYKPAPGQLDGSLAEAARLIVGLHNLHDPTAMSWPTAAHCVASDFIVEGGLAWKPHALAKFLVDLAPSPAGALLGRGPAANHPGGFHAALIAALLCEVAMQRVFDNDRWLLPFPRPDVDPAVAAFLAQSGAVAA